MHSTLNLDSMTLRKLVWLQAEVAEVSMDLSQVLKVIAQTLPSLMPCEGTSLEILARDEMYSVASTGIAHSLLNQCWPLAESFSAEVMSSSQSITCQTDDQRIDVKAARLVEARFILAAPLSLHQKNLGVLKVYSRTQEKFDERTKSILGLIARSVASALANSEELRSRIAKAEAAAVRSKELVELSTRAAEIGVWEWQVKTNQVSCHGVQYHLFGIKKNFPRLEIKTVFQQIHPDDQARVRKSLQSVAQTGGNWEQEFRVIWQDGSIHWLLGKGNAYQNYFCQVERIVGVTIEVTRQKEIEAKLQRALRMRDEFLQLASHELRTPLTCLQLNLDLQKRELIDEKLELSRERLLITNSTYDRLVKRLGILVANMLDISSITSGKLTIIKNTVNLTSLMKSSLERIKPQIDFMGYELPSVSGEELTVHADAERLDQVFINLISNAMKYGEKKPIQIQVWQEDKWVKVEVRDHGMGLPLGMKDKIFDRYTRGTHASDVSGLGLGLSIAREIMVAHGGSIQARSLNQGSAFLIKLPALLS